MQLRPVTSGSLEPEYPPDHRVRRLERRGFRLLRSRGAALTVAAAAVCVAAAPVQAEEHHTPVEATRAPGEDASSDTSEGENTGYPEMDEDLPRTSGTPVALAGVPIRPRRLNISLGVAGRAMGVSNDYALYLGPEITTGLMIRHFEVLLRIGFDIAAHAPPQGTNLGYVVRNELLIGTNFELSRRVHLHIRAGPRVLFFMGYGGVLDLGLSFTPTRRTILSISTRVGVVSHEIVEDPELELSHWETVWSGGLSVSFGFWL